jgi:hypothetical protein
MVGDRNILFQILVLEDKSRYTALSRKICMWITNTGWSSRTSLILIVSQKKTKGTRIFLSLLLGSTTQTFSKKN